MTNNKGEIEKFLNSLPPNERINPRIKAQAVQNLYPANENAIFIASQGLNLKDMVMRVPTMDEALKEHTMYLMTEMGFRPGEGENTWNHCVFEEQIQFDPQTESFTQLVFRIYKAGYKNAKNELHSEIPG